MSTDSTAIAPDLLAENEELRRSCAKLELHSSNLANLYVASYQLHTSIDRDAVLRVVQEIVVNLVGSEEVAIFEGGGEGKEFVLTSSFGIDTDRLSRFRLGDGPIAQRVRSGNIYVNPNAGARPEITACIPLSIGPSLFGVILIFRLLDHKTELQPVDHEIFDLLAVHGATALYCATVREKLAEAVAC